MRWTRLLPLVLITCLLVGLAPGLAAAGSDSSHASKRTPPIFVPPDQPGVQHRHYEFGPVHIRAGQNNIDYSGSQVPRPTEDGWVVGIRPNIHLADGTIPPVDVIHLHHGVWLNLSHGDATSPGLPERFFAAGEEKTALQFPAGYGYRFNAGDNWLINYMIHDLVDRPFDLWIDYDLDFIPASAGVAIKDARPIWMDVQNGSVYPVFDARRGSGGDEYTYPDEATTDPYHGGTKLNTWTVPADGVLIGTGGHLHPGGLRDDLWIDRTAPSKTRTRHLFESSAHYYEPAGAVSWDVAMTVTNPGWRPQLRAGDQLRINVTYDTERASWYEVMGIMIAWYVPGETGTDPFAGHGVDWKRGHLTHGHLAENNNHGGGVDPDLPDARTLPDGPLASLVNIDNYEYAPTDLDLATQVPTIKAGGTVTFTNLDAPAFGDGTWHSITSCAAPCNQTTGVAYPLADGPIEFDSGQLGNFGEPTAGRLSWTTPADLPPGTYNFFCRVHPFMRGAFRVVATGPPPKHDHHDHGGHHDHRHH
ncbi:MAG: hypothetical protein ABJC79_07850 [Acidimicrobiia bacterium]